MELSPFVTFCLPLPLTEAFVLLDLEPIGPLGPLGPFGTFTLTSGT